MITVSEEFKRAVREPIKQMLSYVTDGSDEITENDDLKSLKITGVANIGTAVMRQAEAIYLGTHDYLNSYVNLGIGVYLPDENEIGEVTISIANPCVVTKASHGLVTGDRVKLSTTGELPTGLAVDTSYYVINKYNTVEDEQVLDTDELYLATSYDNALAGTKITTSGSQSGTHTLLFYPLGIGTTPEYIDYGSFKVVSVETNEGSTETKIKMFDKMYEALQQYDLEPTYPITLKQLVEAICTRFSWTLGTATFPNDDLSITAELFEGLQLSFRDILNQVAEASGSIIYFGNDDKLYIKQISESVLETLTSDNLMTLKIEPMYGELNSVVLSRSPQEDNILQKDDESIATYGLNEFKIVNNLILDADRETYIADIFTALNGIKYYPFEANTEGLGYYEFGDRIKVANPSDTEYEVLVMGIDLSISGGFYEKLYAKIPDKTSTAYNYAGIIGQTIKNTQIIVDRQQGQIDLINEELEEVLVVPRQSEPPASPTTNDLWLDTDDNIIYIYDGSEWQPTSISPSALDDYYTKDETLAQITITADTINSSVSVTQTTAQAGLDLANVNAEALETVQTDITELEQSVDALDLTVQSIGGVNLLLNSTGLKGTIEEWQLLDESGSPIDADNDGSVVQTTEVQENSESGSAIMIEEQYIQQTIPTLEGNTYTLYCRFKKLEDLNVYISGISGAIPIADETYTDETWSVFKYQFIAVASTTTIKFDNSTSDAGAYGIIADAVCKIGDVSGWVQAPNEVYGRNYRFDKDGFEITSLTDTFKSVLDNTKLAVYDTAGGTDKNIMTVSKDSGKITKLIAQDEFTVQRYENPESSLRVIPVDDGVFFVIND